MVHATAQLPLMVLLLAIISQLRNASLWIRTAARAIQPAGPKLLQVFCGLHYLAKGMP